MKKRIWRWPIIISLLMLAACVDTRKADEIKIDKEDTESAETIIANEVRGVVGEGTSMHSLELITDQGDSLTLFYENNAIGGLTCGDWVDVSYDNTGSGGELTARSIVNLTALAHLWKIDAKQHLEINLKGDATSYGMPISYQSWEVEGDKLILIGTAAADTFHIVMLSEDSLYMKGKKTYKMKKEN